MFIPLFQWQQMGTKQPQFEQRLLHTPYRYLLGELQYVHDTASELLPGCTITILKCGFSYLDGF